METTSFAADAGRCVRIDCCTLTVGDAHWPLARDHADAIERHWQRRLQDMPHAFNGAVYLLRDYAIDGSALSGTFCRTDFKTFLYWRDQSAVGDGMYDCFGTSLIRSAEGHALLVRQAPGHMNSGLLYTPSGLIDDNDAVGGRIDIEASIVRELHEETGLQAGDLNRSPGYFLGIVGRQLAIAAEWRSALPAERLRDSILEVVSRQTAPELSDIVIVRSCAEIDERIVPAYAQALLRARLPA
jgi:8-oxo-dGTP pyrophosphatase MutT (NUDIX family)